MMRPGRVDEALLRRGGTAAQPSRQQSGILMALAGHAGCFRANTDLTAGLWKTDRAILIRLRLVFHIARLTPEQVRALLTPLPVSPPGLSASSSDNASTSAFISQTYEQISHTSCRPCSMQTNV